MTHKERVLSSIYGKSTDRIPVDYYGIPEATEKYIKELNLKDEFELINYLNADIIRVYPNPGKTAFKRDKEFLKKVDSPAEIKKILEDIPPLDELMDFSHIPNIRNNYPEYAILTYGPGSLFLGNNSAFGYEISLMHHSIRPDLIQETIKCGVDYAVAVMDKFYRDVGNAVDIISLEDDFGTQTSLYISYKMFLTFYKQAFKKIIQHIKNYGYFVQFHSCGAISQIIPDIIEMGADILDPIQVHAKNMEIENLAAKFRGKICFHGGIDTQYLLPYGNTEDIKKEVSHIISILGTTRAFLAPSQNFLPDIPTKNLLAMFTAKRTM
jgi:uroporphyrinogen decarboxylase